MSAAAELFLAAQKEGLPPDWRLATLDDLVGKNGVFVDGDWVESKDQDPDGDVRLIQLADVGDGEYRNKSARFLTHKKALKLGCTFLAKGDVLIARMPDPLGRACIFPGDTKLAVTVVDVAIVRSAAGEFDHRWLMYFVNAPAFRAAVASMQSGSTRKRISRSKLAKIGLPVPPLDQQKRIVAEIEKQFSRLDEAVANLKRVKANLKRFKAAILKAAVEGRLVETEAELARREGRSYETGERLLQRILETRRGQWKGKGKYKEPAVPDTAGMPEVAESWAVASLEQLTSSERVICYGILMPKENVPDGVLYVKVRDLKGDKVDLDSLQRTSPEIAAKYSRASLKMGDILLAIRGTYGRVAEVPPALDGGNITQDTARLAVSPLMDTNYVAWFLRSLDAQSFFKRVARGVAVKGVNIADVRACPVFVPSLPEQRRIVAEVERRFSVATGMESQVDANLKRAERLRRAVLSASFSGRV